MEASEWYKDTYGNKSLGDSVPVEYNNEQEREIVDNFAKKFIESQQDMPRDIAKIVQKHF